MLWYAQTQFLVYAETYKQHMTSRLKATSMCPIATASAQTMMQRRTRAGELSEHVAAKQKRQRMRTLGCWSHTSEQWATADSYQRSAFLSAMHVVCWRIPQPEYAEYTYFLHV